MGAGRGPSHEHPTKNGDVRTVVERRRSLRAPVVVRIEYATVDALFSDFTRNVNEGGVFIETDCPAELDSVVHLRFRLPGTRESIKVTGRVAWIEPGVDGNPEGMGVEFENLTDRDRERINDIVLRLRVER
jgi:type IV pilus assembly protein PilZ